MYSLHIFFKNGSCKTFTYSNIVILEIAIHNFICDNNVISINCVINKEDNTNEKK